MCEPFWDIFSAFLCIEIVNSNFELKKIIIQNHFCSLPWTVVNIFLKVGKLSHDKQILLWVLSV